MASNQSMIVTGVRTPMGAFMGALAGVPASQLGATCVKALVERTGVPADRVDEVIMGTCIAAGQGMNPARQAAIFGGLAPSVHARHDQRGLRLGHEGRDAGRPDDPRGRRGAWPSPAAWRT